MSYSRKISTAFAVETPTKSRGMDGTTLKNYIQRGRRKRIEIRRDWTEPSKIVQHYSTGSGGDRDRPVDLPTETGRS